MIQVVGSPQPHHGVHGQIGKVILLVREELGAEGGPGDAEEVVAELGVVPAVVDAGGLEGGAGGLLREAPPLGDGLGVDALADEVLGLAPDGSTTTFSQ